MLDKQPFSITEFKGANLGSANPYFDINSQDSIQFSDSVDPLNLIFLKEGGIQTRPPFVSRAILTKNVSDNGELRQHWKIARLGTTYYDDRWLYLTYDAVADTGKFYDTASIIPGTILATISKCQFASVVNIFGRLYISPLIDFAKPLNTTDGVIWLYDGTNFRKSGGTAPTGAGVTCTDTNVVGSNVTAGLHLCAIAFETDSGFVTGLGPTARISVTVASSGNRAIRFANVQLGPAGTVARHLLVTKYIPTYDGIPDNWELFFGYRIPDNTTTTADVTVPDTGLVDSADYLLSEFSSVPACNAISVYGSRLMFNGPYNDSRVIYVSKPADPETVDQSEDFIQIFDGIPADIYNGAALRGLYYIFKSTCTYVTREELDTPPNAWKPDLVDSGLGIAPWGIARVMANPGGLILDNLLVVGMYGVYVFSGTYERIPLSYKIQPLFNNLDGDEAKYLRMDVDPIRRRIYLLVGLPQLATLWMGDYFNGLSPETIKWCKWIPYYTAENVVTPDHVWGAFVDPNNTITKKPDLTVITDLQRVIELDETNLFGADDYGPSFAAEIPWQYPTGFTASEMGYIYTFALLTLRVACNAVSNNIIIDGITFDDTSITVTVTLAIDPTPKRMYTIPFNIVSEQVRIGLSGVGNVLLTKLLLWASERAQLRPNA